MDETDVMRHLVGSVAVAVQRGMAMTYLAGFEQAVVQLGKSEGKEARREERATGKGRL